MNSAIHERACHLIDAWHVEGLTAGDREWLDAHLAECGDCRDRARASERALQALRSHALTTEPGLVGATQARVRMRARELRENQARWRALWIACAFSWILGALTAPLLWHVLGWLGRSLEMSQVVRLALFACCWFAPASVVGVILAWKQARLADTPAGPKDWEH